MMNLRQKLSNAGHRNYVWVSWDRFAQVDFEEWERVQGFKWRLVNNIVTTKIEINGEQKLLPLANLILNLPETIKVGYKYNNPMNCRKSNLVIANAETEAENLALAMVKIELSLATEYNLKDM